MEDKIYVESFHVLWPTFNTSRYLVFAFFMSTIFYGHDILISLESPFSLPKFNGNHNKNDRISKIIRY